MLLRSFAIFWHMLVALKNQLYYKTIAVVSSFLTCPQTTVSRTLLVHSSGLIGKRFDNLTAMQEARINGERSRRINRARLMAHATAKSNKQERIPERNGSVARLSCVCLPPQTSSHLRDKALRRRGPAHWYADGAGRRHGRVPPQMNDSMNKMSPNGHPWRRCLACGRRNSYTRDWRSLQHGPPRSQRGR